MKQGEIIVFLVKPEEISALAQGHPLTIRPTNGMPTFLLMADPPVLPPMNGQPPSAIEAGKDYTVHRRAPGKGQGRFECKCGVTAKTLSRLFRHQKKAHP